MKIVVLVKEVPDSSGERKLDTTTGLADREASDRVLDEVTGRAVEAAVTYAESAESVEVVLVTMGPESAGQMLRKTLATGADRATHVVDEGLTGADMGLSAEVLATAVSHLGADLVLAGNVSSDGAGGMLPAMVAQRLGVPHLTSLDVLEITETQVKGTRAGYGGVVSVRAELPAVVSVSERLPDPRFPGLKGVMSAKKKPLETLSLEQLGVDAGADVPRSIMVSVTEAPTRSAGTKVTDEGEAGIHVADYLAEKRLV